MHNILKWSTTVNIFQSESTERILLKCNTACYISIKCILWFHLKTDFHYHFISMCCQNMSDFWSQPFIYDYRINLQRFFWQLHCHSVLKTYKRTEWCALALPCMYTLIWEAVTQRQKYRDIISYRDISWYSPYIAR